MYAPVHASAHRSRTLLTTLNSRKAYLVAVVPAYSRKKTGRLQHGLWLAWTQVAAVAPVRTEPRPRLAQLEQEPVLTDATPGHVADGVADATVASFVTLTDRVHSNACNKQCTG